MNQRKRQIASTDGSKPIENESKPDNSPYIFQRDKLKKVLDIKSLKWTDKQLEVINLVASKECKLLFIKGCAGTSKTTLAMYAELQALNKKQISTILLVRAAVESSDSKLGLLPGEISSKIGPYLIPFYDKLSMFLSKGDMEILKKENRIEAVPVGFARGQDWQIIGAIIDEGQSMTRKEMLTLLSRIGKYCKVIVCFDPDQSDIKNSGCEEVYDLFNNPESEAQGIFCRELTEVLRSDLCAYICDQFKKLPKKV